MLRSACLTALLLAAACAGEVRLAQEVGHMVVHATGDCPASVTASIQLGIGGCDEVLEPEVERRGGVISVRPWVLRPDGACIAILLAHDLSVPLGRYRDGTYRVVVEGELVSAEQTFTIPDTCR